MNRFKICTAILVVLGMWGCASNEAFDPGSVCPENPLNKTEPGTCGCFIADVDADGNGVVDCLESSSTIPVPLPEKDECEDDDNKTDPGMCGCGVPEDDSDGDKVPDCLDRCIDDPDKFEPGFCGCNKPDEDTNNNGIPDCKENCEPRCEGDTFIGCDGNLYVDAIDCTDSNMICVVEEGEPGCTMDKCRYNGSLLDDSAKICDGDKLLVCVSGQMIIEDCDNDFICRYDDLQQADCRDPNEDLCPDDPNKTDPGECGCGIPEDDSNHNDIKDCKENCTPGCDGDTLIVCEGKLFAEPVVCTANGRVCGLNNNVPECVEPDLRCAYLDEMLEPGTKRCNADGKLLTCTDGKLVASDCPDNKICDAGECRALHECTVLDRTIAHGESICFSNVLILACNDGTVAVKESCNLDSNQNELVCVTKETGPACVVFDDIDYCMDDYGEYVEPGVQICDDEMMQIVKCIDGGWDILEGAGQCTENQICVMENNTPTCVAKPLVFDSIQSLREAVATIIDGATCDTTATTKVDAQVDVEGSITAIDGTKGFYIQDASAAVYVNAALPSGIALYDRVSVKSDAVGGDYCRLQIVGTVNVNKVDVSTPILVEPVPVTSSDVLGIKYDNALNSVLIIIENAKTDSQYSDNDDPIKGWDIVFPDDKEMRIASYFIPSDTLKTLMDAGKEYDLTGILEYQKNVGFIAPRDENDIFAHAVCFDFNDNVVGNGAHGCKSADTLALCDGSSWKNEETCPLGCDAVLGECSSLCAENGLSCKDNIRVTCIAGQAPTEMACPMMTPACVDGIGCVACVNNSNCTSPYMPICNTETYSCVQCKADTDCTSTTAPVCNISTHTCAQCNVNADCKSTAPVCTSMHTCVQCNADTDCTDATKPVCNATTNMCAECNVDTDCTTDPTKPFCNTTMHTCAQCMKDADCGTKQTCSPLTHACTDVECTEDSHCTDATKPVCNTTMHTCAQCMKDADCGSAAICSFYTCTSVECTSNSDCKDDSKPICNTSTHTCRACLSSEPCPV